MTTEAEMSQAIRMMCERQIGVLDSNFLCQSVSVLNPPAPRCVLPGTSLGDVVEVLQTSKIGSVLVTDSAGRLQGIFTERDCVRKVLPAFHAVLKKPVEEFMTKDVVAQPPDITIAFALNLMSHGGFRHLPLVDSDSRPIGIVSVRDLIDFLAQSFMNSLLEFKTEA